ncbi:Xre family transcriptional regulator [Actinophytocola oryzae]|uniref:Xre family transcriptional regulator n=2 Tax=Actinophytocola oryzae TaxID=502181 RepID=A0A4R7VR09_9PSEU|nr:Xre family transcriptional regulator [Actinophytocola oryzae]
MVIRLAESLEVPLRERNTLLLSAGYAPAYQESDWNDESITPVRRALESVLRGHEPYPAILVDRRGNLVAANNAFHTLTEDVAPDLRVPPINVARLFLHPEGLAPRIANLDEWAWHVLDGLRLQTARNPNPQLTTLIDELVALVPNRPKKPGPEHLGFAVPLRLHARRGELHLMTTLSHFGTALDVTVAELKLEAFLPADEKTAALLATTITHQRTT